MVNCIYKSIAKLFKNILKMLCASVIFSKCYDIDTLENAISFDDKNSN